MMPGMGMGMMGGINGKNGPVNPLQYQSNPQMYYVYKGVLPPSIPYNSTEGQMLIWEYEREQADEKEREKKRQRFRETMQEQMDFKLQNFMDPEKLGMGMGGNNTSNMIQQQMSQAMIAAGTHTPSYITNADGSTSMIAVPKQNNGQNGEMASISNIYTQLINTMKTINETVIQNLTKPNEYKDKLVDVAFNNLLGNMDPIAQVERTKALMESFQPPMSQGNNIRDVIDTANYMLQSKKLDYDAKFVEKQQEREENRWKWEREQEQRSEQESKSNTINLIKTFSELLPNAIGPLLQIVSLVKGGGAGGGGGGLGGLGGLGSLLGGLGGMMGGGAQQQQQQQPGQPPGQGIDMNEIMGMANNMIGQMMGGGGGGGQMSQGPFGTPGGIYNQQNPVGGYTPNPYASPDQSPPVDTSKFSPYFRQHVAPQTSGFNPKFEAPPSETWTSDFESNIPVWNEQPQQQPQPQQFVTQTTTQTQQWNEPMETEQKGILEFSDSDFELKGTEELESYLQDIENTRQSLFNAEQTVVNVLNRKKVHKAPVIERQTPKPEKIIVETKEEVVVDGEQEKSITDTTIHKEEQKSDSDMGNKDSILDDIHKKANESVDSIL
jgi:hypothetical protein